MNEDYKKTLIRLKRIEGQIRGLQKMIGEDKTCEEVLTQLAAARAALDKVGMNIISQRMKDCFLENSETSAEEATEKALEIFQKYISFVQ